MRKAKIERKTKETEITVDLKIEGSGKYEIKNPIGFLTHHRAHDVLAGLAEKNILGGLDVSADYPEIGEAVLVCATETKSADDIDDYAGKLGQILG